MPYDNAKAINRTYLKENRIKKINYQQRYQKAKLNLSRKKTLAMRHDDQLSFDELQNLLSDSSSSHKSSSSIGVRSASSAKKERHSDASRYDKLSCARS